MAGNLLEMAGAGAASTRGTNSAGGGVSSTGAPTTSAAAAPVSAARTTVASFKGRANGCEVAGLSPNTLYHFRVRAVNTRTRSSLSSPLEVCEYSCMVAPTVLSGRTIGARLARRNQRRGADRAREEGSRKRVDARVLLWTHKTSSETDRQNEHNLPRVQFQH